MKHCYICGSGELKREVGEHLKMFKSVFGSDTRVESITCMMCGAVQLFDFGVSKLNRVPNDEYYPNKDGRKNA